MSVIPFLSISVGVRNENPNIELAQQIIKKKDLKAIEELIVLLNAKQYQKDSIKVLYEIGYLKPEFISPYYNNFISLLKSKNNRLQWCAMTALSCIVNIVPKELYANLPIILETADKGTVITRDHAMKILAQLGKKKEYSKSIFPLAIEQLQSCPTNQLPMYAELTMQMVEKSMAKTFLQTLYQRLQYLEYEPKRKRIEKVILTIQKKYSF
ncbi:MAG: hypothetical protein R2831_12540 [Chitinophagaceae bacterium]